MLLSFLDSLCIHVYVSLLGKFLSEEFLNLMFTTQLTVAEITSFQKWLYQYIKYMHPPQGRKIAITRHLCQHLVFLSFLILVILLHVDMNHSDSNLCFSNDHGG